jgi:stage III sporulation protein AA
MLTTNPREIAEIFNSLCSFSIYSKQNEIKNGYVTITGGHRVGICGTAVIDNNSMINIRNISSMNIRVSGEHKGCSKELLAKIDNINSGVLICGAPCSGKTTILRDLARILSTEYNSKVSLIDQRSEISATYKGVPQYDVGMCDVLNCYSKCDGFDQAIRCMSPDIIICDEIGTSQDIASLESSVNSGVAVIASAHCANIQELKEKPQFRNLLSSGAFNYIAFLSNRKNVGQLDSVVKINELTI